MVSNPFFLFLGAQLSCLNFTLSADILLGDIFVESKSNTDGAALIISTVQQHLSTPCSAASKVMTADSSHQRLGCSAA